MAQDLAGRPDNRSVNPGVRQAHVDPHTIILPVVDGKDIRFTRLSTDDGLSQTRVLQIVQDDQGFMWFGSQYGLNRYDGYKFKVFKHEPGNPNSLSGVFISSLFKDRSGSLWIGCDEFLDRFDPVTETFTHYRIDSEGAPGEAAPVTNISQDRMGILWLSTLSGLYRFDPSTGGIIRYRHDPNNRFSLSDDDIKATGEDRTGTFWVGTSEGLDAFDRDTGKVTLHVLLHEHGEMSFYEDRFGVFWIVNVTGGGLAVFDRKTNTLRDVYLPCAGRNQPGYLEQAGPGVTCRDPASVVEHMVVPRRLCGRFFSAARRILSMAHSAIPEPGKASARRCGNNSGNGVFCPARRVY
jgi:hypothetical protein